MIDKEIWDLAWEENLVGRTEWHRWYVIRYDRFGLSNLGVQISRAIFLLFNRYIYRDDNKKLAVMCKISIAVLTCTSLEFHSPIFDPLHFFGRCSTNSPSICPPYILEKLLTILSNTAWHFNCFKFKSPASAKEFCWDRYSRVNWIWH